MFSANTAAIIFEAIREQLFTVDEILGFIVPSLICSKRGKIDYQLLATNYPPNNEEYLNVYLKRLANLVHKSESVLIKQYNDGNIRLPFVGTCGRIFTQFGQSSKPALKPQSPDIQPTIELVSISAIRLQLRIRQNGITQNYILHECGLVSDGTNPDVTEHTIKPMKKQPRIKPVKAGKPIATLNNAGEPVRRRKVKESPIPSMPESYSALSQYHERNNTRIFSDQLTILNPTIDGELFTRLTGLSLA